MPTGYTANISKGVSFRQFALDCARAFGACIDLRDSPADAAIPDVFEPSDYHQKALASARERLAEVSGMTATDAVKAAAKAWDDAETRRTVQLAEIADQRSKYEAMLAHAKAWVPPTSDHVEMKRFMLQQIEESIKFDCSTSCYDKPTVRMSGAQWLEHQRAEVDRDIEHHSREYENEVKRCADRTAWVAALRASI